MKKQMKMRRYNEGDEVTVDDDVEPEVIRRSYASGVRVNYDDDETPKRAKRFGKKSDDDSYDRKEKSRSSGSSKKSDDEDTSAVTGRMLAKRDKRSAEEKAAENKYIRENITGPLVTSVGVGRVAKGAYEVGKAAKRVRDISQATKAQEMTAKEAAVADRIRARQDMFGSGKAAREYAEAGGMKRGGSVKSSASKRADGIASRGKTKGRMI
jgi:hypothetical protein